MIPLLVLGFLLAGLLLAGSTATSAALLARRRLAADCDAAALAGATAVARNPAPAALRLDPRRAAAAAAAALPAGVQAVVTVDRDTVTVRCRRAVRVPFGAVVGRPQGIERTALSRARARIRPST